MNAHPNEDAHSEDRLASINMNEMLDIEDRVKEGGAGTSRRRMKMPTQNAKDDYDDSGAEEEDAADSDDDEQEKDWTRCTAKMSAKMSGVEKRKADGGTGNVGSILAGCKGMPLPAKKAKTRVAQQNMGGNPFQTLACRLHQIREEILKEFQLGPGCVVEIEAKLGLIVNSKTEGRMGPFTSGAGAIEVLPADMCAKHYHFVSGVSKRDFETYHAVQKALPSCDCSKSLTNAYTFKDHKRIQTDAHGKVIMEQKTKEREFQVHLPSCAYDCRITVSIERPLEPCEAPEMSQDWASHRIKDRSSYRPADSKWQADLTTVTSRQGAEHSSSTAAAHDSQAVGKTQEETYEVELELRASDCTEWIGLTDAHAAKKRTEIVAMDLWQRLTAMNLREETAGALTAVKDSALVSEGHRACLRAFGAENSSNGGGERSGKWCAHCRTRHHDFPGTMPVGFSKLHVPKVQSEQYWVSEKTDGVRFFLVVVKAEGGELRALLFNRKFEAFTMVGMAELGKALGEGTLLDGEVVRNRSWRRDMFMVFDCMSVEHAPCVQVPLSRRLAKLQTEVLERRYLKFLAATADKSVHPGMSMLPLVMKRFHPSKHVAEITRHISMEGSVRVYLEKDAQGRPKAKSERKRHHKSDGLIFAPELPYHRGTDLNYMKWKWHDAITLDLTCRREDSKKVQQGTHHGVSLSFEAEGRSEVDFTERIVLGVHEKHRLYGDLDSAASEWEWSPKDSGWIYKMPRPDKSNPNFSRTVLATIMEAAEGMEIQELEYLLTFARQERTLKLGGM